MPDFNTGDFTQQGVNGHVNSTVRLNEKRLVNIDMTSNENAEGCTITGTVKDLLNNKVYNIGSAPSGNIEITENGENINVAAYATATVNVSGGGGITTANITFVPTFPNGETFMGVELGPLATTYEYYNDVDDETVVDTFTGNQIYSSLTENPVVTIPVLWSNTLISIGSIVFYDTNSDQFGIDTSTIVVTGDGSYIDNELVVSGDCTVTCTLSEK